MGYALFLTENLVWSLLLVATVTACAGRLRRGWLRLMLALPVPLVLLLIHVCLTVVAGFLQFPLGIVFWFYPMLALTVMFFAGTAWIVFRGLHRAGAESAITFAAGWPRGKLATAFGAAFALYCMTFWNLDLAARQQLAAVRVEAGALVLSAAPARVPDRDNAALVYDQAYDAIRGRSLADHLRGEAWRKEWEEKATTWATSGKFDFDLHDPELRPFLARLSPALALVRRAANMPGCVFEHDYGRPSMSMALPETNWLYDAARLMTLDAICSASDGKHARAIEDINALFLMSEQMAGDPFVVTALVAMSIDKMAIEAIQIVVTVAHLPANDLAKVSIPDSVSYRGILRRGLRYEEALRLATFDDVGTGRIDLADIVIGPLQNEDPKWFVRWAFSHGFVRSLLSPIYRVFILSDDLAAHRRFTTETEQAAQLPYQQSRERSLNMDRQLRAEPGGILTAALVPSLGSIIEAAVKADARRDAARLGLALYAYRARNGMFPANLDELTPEFIAAAPPDPFDGKPMRMKKTDRGMTVYSVGPDMIDDGGKPLDEEKKGDIPFTVPDLEKGRLQE